MGDGINLEKSKTLSQLSCRIDDFSSEILEMVNANSRGDLYKDFVRKFLKYIPVDYRSRDKINFFGDFTHEAFEFFMYRPAGSRKIEIRVTEFQGDPSITILIATENRPFIIDSLNSLIQKLSLQNIFTFHPVIPCIRDKGGKLQEITTKGDGIINESLVYVRVLGTFDEATLSLIKSEINNIIDLVDCTYNSWQPLLNKITAITKNIISNKELYEKAKLPAWETLEFLNWLQKNNITLLGSVDFDVESKKLTAEEGVKEIWQNNLEQISSIIEFSKSEYYSNKLAMLGKINKLSPVHRNALVDYILVKNIDSDGVYRSGTIIFGLYGTAIYFQSVHNVPILREKLDYVLNESGFAVNGYNVKKIKNIVESLPRDILIQIGDSDLYCMCIHMLSSMRSHKLKLFIQQDWSSSFINVIIFLSREKLTPEVYKDIIHYLTDKFGSEIIVGDITVVAQDFSHLFVTIPIDDASKLDFSHDDIEEDLIKITTNWSEKLLQKLSEELGEYKAGVRHKQIEPSFPEEYRYRFDSNIVLDDIYHLEQVSKSDKLGFNLIQESDNEFILKFYSSKVNLKLSDMLPAIENLGFVAIDEQSFTIKESPSFKQSWIYVFNLAVPNNIGMPFKQLKHNIEEALTRINEGSLDNSELNKLILLSGFDWTKVKLLKSLTSYLHQIGFLYGKGYVRHTLIKHSKFTEMLVNLFAAKFNPKIHSKEKVSSLSKEMELYLESVESSNEDKVLQNLRLIIEAIVRTNFYQNGETEIKDYLSFKFRSSKVPDLPLPVPYAEIFVYSNDFEGIHLRGGKVARGGLRWSDRVEDYRTEVLGLMKSQITKNTVIVPVGSKGSFCIKFSQGLMERREYMQKVVLCYQNFLRGLLDITDNLEGDKVVHPASTMIYDDPNPYLVVAADKGTASFSDYANEISKEYNFWLGDAFASGGSVGYDHKKMAITAKGAWISAQLHFLDMGIDIQSEPFTVVGIGDMSGDVFGNGMLLSEYIKLVAAFNHKHIFIDPDPDCKISYEERKRLFVTPNTQWSDYNKELISKGGGVFDRTAKVIHISEEIQKLLDISNHTITPDKLISAILKSRVDLIWNGGIGTYIKSSSENNADIGDKANDSLRINGNEVRARVISEGGNLGLSQLGRIEYSLSGGRINTDFIDNSAGVDCSDHEVNIKIALNSAVASGRIDIQQRNKILEDMTDSVAELVLKDNYNQNLAITISQFSTAVNIEFSSQLIKELENEGLLNSEVEFLPNKTELSRRLGAKEGMTRPEIAVLLSYSKMSFYNGLSSELFEDDKYFEKYLFDYFPQAMRDQFEEEIHNHPLRNEIIKTIISNKIVNQLGGTLISAIKRQTGGNQSDIARAYCVVTEIFALDDLWHKIEELTTSVDISIKVEMFSDLRRIMRRGISWFVRNSKYQIDINGKIKEFGYQIDTLTGIISQLLVGTTKTKFFNKIGHYKAAGVDDKLAESVATLEVLVSAFDIIFISNKTDKKIMDIANLYFASGDVFSIDWLRQSCDAQINGSYWNRLSIQSLKDDFYDKQRRLVISIVSENLNNLDIRKWLEENSTIAAIFVDFVEDIKMQEIVNLNMLILANKKLEMFLRKIKVE